ncbi:hypothetical protein [Weissella paramesenteroides]|uniref:hypothetical protein n=1 Tax=Weissella paramesenteroides TaxID=1249 RepID=UPI00123BA364|nr:hypothetical protein [Weissella paramesenteroides]KAA8445031.1 hypothetical protein FKV72_07725 [Weissella paramesenteroides]KAA8452632.1 hypothetical protein FKV71_04445 [Weissella paramesenteroides]
MIKFLKKYWRLIIVIFLIFIFIGVPVLIQCHVAFIYNPVKKMTPGDRGDWLQFWGSYLGVLPSGVIAALVAGYQIKAANKQSNQSRQQELIMMRNSKLIDYCYEMKGVVSKSIVVLDARIQLENKISLGNQDLASIRYRYFMLDTAKIFEYSNYESLKKANNNMHFITNVLSNLMEQEMVEEQNKYTKNLVLLERFFNSYRQYKFSASTTADTIEEFPDIKEMKKQLDNISKMIDKQITKLSA